jgi:hypothetical protein
MGGWCHIEYCPQIICLDGLWISSMLLPTYANVFSHVIGCSIHPSRFAKLALRAFDRIEVQPLTSLIVDHLIMSALRPWNSGLST